MPGGTSNSVRGRRRYCQSRQPPIRFSEVSHLSAMLSDPSAHALDVRSCGGVAGGI
jgi:hypothetical protein